MTLTIGMIGAGEMGAALAKSFVAAGHLVLADLTGRSKETRTRAAEAGITEASSLAHLISKADVLFSVLPTQVAKAQAAQVAHLIQQFGHALCFVEANAIAPSLLRDVAAMFNGSKTTFIDGGIIGPPPNGTTRPRLYATGPDLSVLQSLDGTGFDLVEISGELGQASAFKMTYAALTKGTNALLTNAMLAAQANGFLDQFTNEIKASQSVLEARARTNIPLLPADAARWQDEMQQIARHFDDLGLPPDFHLGARIVMEILAQSVFGHETRRTRDTTRSLEATIQGIFRPNRTAGCGRIIL